MMKSIRQLTSSDLKWSQPSATRADYELRAGGELAGTLRFRSAFGTLATGECADGCWTFKRVGFFQTRVTIRKCGEELDVASFRNNTWMGGGTLEFTDGTKILANTNFWQTRLQFTLESGKPVGAFTKGGMIHLNVAVEVDRSAVGLDQMPLIVLLGCYLIVMMQNDAAASAAIIG